MFNRYIYNMKPLNFVAGSCSYKVLLKQFRSVAIATLLSSSWLSYKHLKRGLLLEQHYRNEGSAVPHSSPGANFGFCYLPASSTRLATESRNFRHHVWMHYTHTHTHRNETANIDVCILHAAAPHLPNLDDLDDKQAEEMLADMMFNDNDLSEYASISQDGNVSYSCV